MSYGKELVLDLHECDPARFTEMSVGNWFHQVCWSTDMVPVKAYYWEDSGNIEPHLNGISAIQFISTSSIVIHASTDLRQAHINVFACKDFDAELVAEISKLWFGGKIVSQHVLERP